MPNYNVFNKEDATNKSQMYAISSGNLIPLASDSNGVLQVQLSNSSGTTQNLPLTAFNDLRVAEINPSTGYTINYNINTDLLKVTTSSGGLVTAINSKAVIQTTTSTTGMAKMETIRALRYQSGMGSQVRFTAVFTSGVVNSTQLIGIGDSKDGFFFGYDGVNFGILRLQNEVFNWTYQTSWNKDKMNGTGISGVTLDTTKGNVYIIQYQWLGFGLISFSIENPTTGDFINVHNIEYANANTNPSVFNPTLPLMAKVEKTSGTDNIVIQTSSGIGLIEGPIDNSVNVTRNSISNSKTGIVGIVTNILTIKNNTTFQSKTNRVRIKLDYLSLSSITGSKPSTIDIVKNATLGGTPDYNDINANTSVVSYDTEGTTINGGTHILSFKLGVNGSNQLNLSSLDLQLEPGSTITISAVSESGSNAQVDASLSWLELW